MFDEPVTEKTAARPRVTIRLLMIAIVIAAVDFALAAGLHRRSPLADWPTHAIIVLAYDALVYFTYLALLKIIHPQPGEREFSGLTVAIAVVVIPICAGLPIVFAILVLLGLRV